MRLAANYDVNKGLKVVLPGIEKSYRSLMVIPQLKPFTKNSKELSALGAYKSQLEKSLSEVLGCYTEDLYEEDILAEKMILVSAVTESVKKKFFGERLSTLFSSNYRVYLMLKNRYFLHRLKRSGNKSSFNELQKSRELNLKSLLHKTQGRSLVELKENTDFRVIEHLVKEQISKSPEKLNLESQLIEKRIDGKTLKKRLVKSKQTELAVETKPLAVSESKEVRNFSFETVIHEHSEGSVTAFEQLCVTYSEPLKK